jgi:hypothetical protein
MSQKRNRRQAGCVGDGSRRCSRKVGKLVNYTALDHRKYYSSRFNVESWKIYLCFGKWKCFQYEEKWMVRITLLSGTWTYCEESIVF